MFVRKWMWNVAEKLKVLLRAELDYNIDIPIDGIVNVVAGFC